jgi:hypothetical protein
MIMQKNKMFTNKKTIDFLKLVLILLMLNHNKRD